MFIEKLLDLASVSAGPTVIPSASLVDGLGRSETLVELFRLLSTRNGFYAFEGALHVLPWLDSRSEGGSPGLLEWNEKGFWRDWYQGLTDGLFFFAEDIFGGQFAIRGNDIVSFDPESGEIEVLASSLEGWGGEVISNYAQLTGFPVAHAWQLVHGPIPIGKRLLPKIPFVLGGGYEEANLFAVDAVKGMRYRGELWQQIRDLPDGAQVRLKALPLQ